MADETTTSNSEKENSEVQTQTSESPAQGSSTSTTETEADKIDLGASTETTDEAKTEGEKPDETKDGEPDPKAELFGAPEGDAGYDLGNLELPEGMTIDQDALAAATPVFKELGLSNKGAALVAQTYAEKIVPAVEQRFTSEMEQRIVAQRTEWEGETRDVVAGKVELKNAAGEPLKFDSNELKGVQSTAARALDKLAPQGFREWLTETGLGVHPMMIAFCNQAGQLLLEDRDFDPSEGGGRKELTREQKYYG